MKTIQEYRIEMENANPRQLYGTLRDRTLKGLGDRPMSERKLFGLDKNGREIRVGSEIRFTQFGKEKLDVVRHVIRPEYKLPDGQILYPQRELWFVGNWPLSISIHKQCEVMGNVNQNDR